MCVPVVPALAFADAGEDAVDGGGAGLEDGGHHDGGAEEELAVCGCEGGVVGEFPWEGAHDGASGGVGEVEEGVHVGEKLETDVHCRLGGVDDAGPDVGFLADGA